MYQKIITNTIKMAVRYFCIIMLIFSTLSCAGDDSKKADNDDGNSDPDTSENTDQYVDPIYDCRTSYEAQLTRLLENMETDTDFTLYLESEDGYTFTFSTGESTLSTSYNSASTSKWVSAVIILRLVDQGILSLQDRPQDHISDWEIPDSDPLYNLTLAELLSLTSGLAIDDICVNLADSDFETCVRHLAAINIDNGRIPGAEFDYGHAHLQLAGLMAIKAVGVDTWQDLFEAFKADTGLFHYSAYDYPSYDNPRLAAGMYWQARDYIDFIRAFQFGDLLSDATKSQMLTDQIRTTVIADSPIIISLNQEWHYGFGIWLECPQVVFNCQSISTYSSPGIYGAYPFMNTQHRFFGIVARQGRAETIAQGKAVYDAVAAVAEQWAQVPVSCQ